MLPVVENAQHELQSPWFFTGVKYDLPSLSVLVLFEKQQTIIVASDHKAKTKTKTKKHTNQLNQEQQMILFSILPITGCFTFR